jgi:hypothetical protein
LIALETSRRFFFLMNSAAAAAPPDQVWGRFVKRGDRNIMGTDRW